MARSFWSRQKSTSSDPYATTTGSRSRSALLTIVGVILVGGALFGVFQGARWTFGKLAGDADTTPSSTSSPISTPVNTPGSGSITATTSTSTTRPSTQPAPSSATIPASNTQSLPQTGAGSNTAIFFAVLVISYVIFRKKSLKNQ